MNSVTDQEIVQLFRDQNTRERAFRLLIEKFQQRIYWHVRRMVISHQDADDVVQNTFIKVWEKFHTFRSESGIYTWLYRIATHEALSHLKKNRKERAGNPDDYEKLLESCIDDPAWFTGDQIEKRFQKALMKLPDKQRTVFNMKYFDGMKYEEISEILGTSVGALKASYHHAVKKLEKMIMMD